MSCSKSLLILFNSLLLLCGIAICISASVIATNVWPDELNYVFADIHVEYWGWVLPVLGLICIILAIVGLVGTCTGTRCVLWTYIIALVVFVIAEIGIGIYLVGQKDNLSWTQSWNSLVTDAVKEAYPSNAEVFHYTFENCPEHPSMQNTEICSVAVLDAIKNDWWVIGCVCIGLGVLQMILIVLSCAVIVYATRQHQERCTNDIEMQKEMNA